MRTTKPRAKEKVSGTTMAVLYARVSSKEQEKEGYSIPAQINLLQEYAAQKGYSISREYVDVETAKRAGRQDFSQMVSFFRKERQKGPAVSSRILLVEKTDRLYRNIKDWVIIDDLDIEIHFVKEGVVLSAESRSSEKFMHGIKVLMATLLIAPAAIPMTLLRPGIGCPPGMP